MIALYIKLVESIKERKLDWSLVVILIASIVLDIAKVYHNL